MSKDADKKARQREEAASRPRPAGCEICGVLGNVHWDHNHQTGEFRGWLCSHCNTALGLARDSQDILLAMVDYLGGRLVR